MEQKEQNGIAANCPDEPESGKLNMTQMGKIAGGLDNPDRKFPTAGLDCFICPGLKCGWILQQISGNLYRCVNPQCELLGENQYPTKH